MCDNVFEQYRYVHAYQSLVWNLMASRRVQLGLQCVAGDLVLVPHDDPRASFKSGDRKGTAVKVRVRFPWVVVPGFVYSVDY